MLIQIAPNLWHMERGFKAAGLPVSSRMTVVRFDDGRLWLHSPVRFDEAVAGQLRILGVPFVNEVVWFHKASQTLIMTDVLQCWCGNLDWKTALYARLTGVRER